MIGYIKLKIIIVKKLKSGANYIVPAYQTIFTPCNFTVYLSSPFIVVLFHVHK